MFDDLPFPYIASLPFQMISSNLLLPLNHLNYTLPYMYVGLPVKCPLFSSDGNETWITWKDFQEILKFHENLPSGGRDVLYRPTDMTKLSLFFFAVLRTRLKKVEKNKNVPAHSTKACRWSRCIAPLVLNFGATWRNVVIFTLWSFQTW
jgi:hypothetical protein